jgi:hypothetical protein
MEQNIGGTAASQSYERAGTCRGWVPGGDMQLVGCQTPTADRFNGSASRLAAGPPPLNDEFGNRFVKL